MADSELRESERPMEALKSDATEYTIASEQPKRGEKSKSYGKMCLKSRLTKLERKMAKERAVNSRE